MKRYNTLIFVLFSIIIINSCNSNPTSPIEHIPIGENAYHQIIITQTDYQSFNISNNEHFILDSQKISSIILGDKNSGIFYGNDTSQAVYEPVGSNFRLKFNFYEEIDDTTLMYKFTIRYVFTDNSICDLDTFNVTYKYPYNSTEIFTKYSNVLEPPAFDIQSFDIVDSNLYYHPYGPLGMYEYNMTNFQTTLKLDYAGGDYLAATQNYVFCDVSHYLVYRYNLTSDTTDLIVDLSSYLEHYIAGMDVFKNKLYVLTDNGKILILNLDLQFEGMIPYTVFALWLTIKDNIAYSNDYNQIVRFNINTNSYMESIPLPTSKCHAIRIIGDKMFFTDDTKKIIGYFNLSDL